MLSAAASLGMILLWDVDGGLTQIDKYLYSSEDYIKVKLGRIKGVCCRAVFELQGGNILKFLQCY